jgi:FAD/FMN-containing dehydrogenase
VVLAFMTYAGPVADLLRPRRYPEMFMPAEEDYHPVAVGRTTFVDDVDDDGAAEIVEALEASSAPMRVAQLRVLGGAMARVPVDATAFAHRQRRLMATVAAMYQDPADEAAHAAWVERLSARLQRGESGAYTGFLGDEGGGRIREAYPGPTWDRLADVKRRYDPDNLFRRNQNVPPAADRAA